MIKFLTEYAPIIVFFVCYKLYGIFYATGCMMGATIIALIIAYSYEKKIPKITLISACILFLSSSLTLFTGDSSFIKIKPTIAYSIFGLILYIGLFYKKIFLKSMLGHAIKLSDENWVILSKRFAFFFFFMAILNEIIWRNFPEDFWVNYKLFGTPGLMFLFFFSQTLFLYKNNLK
jgi:intracellular septation protein